MTAHQPTHPGGRFAPPAFSHHPPPTPRRSARQLACRYGVSVMTAQRALGELQRQHLTFSIVGRGTFVHPGALTALHGDATCATTRAAVRPRSGPAQIARLHADHAAELAHIARYQDAATAEEREAALLAHIGWHHQQMNPPWKDDHDAHD